MTRQSSLFIVLTCFSLSLACADVAPRYAVDPYWPKRLPNNWVLGQVRGVATDSKDHVWVLNQGVPSDNAAASRTPPLAQCCIPAPAVLEFDAEGNVVRSWGGPGFVPAWPKEPRAIHVDKQGSVWIAGVASPWNSTPATSKPTGEESWDRQVLKFSADGGLLLTIGSPSNAPVNNQDTSLLGAPSAIFVDDAAKEVYIADGFLNRRIVVYDSSTGAYKRGWGARGVALDQIDNSSPLSFPTTRDASARPSRQFVGITDLVLSKDGLLYVTDQMNYRVQVFTKRGKFVKEFEVAPHVLGFEATWSVALSRDKKQRHLLVTDGESGVVRVIDRGSGAELGKLGHKGRNAGQFSNLGWVALDSKGTMYTGEVHFTRSWDGRVATMTGRPDTPGGRLQRFRAGE